MTAEVGTTHYVYMDTAARETVRSRIDISDCFKGMKSIYDCTQEQIKLLTERVQQEQAKLERKARPPAGYEMHCVNYDPASPNDVEVYLEACEEREPGSKMEFPEEKNPCPFDNVDSNKLFPCEQPKDELSLVLKSKQGKPLVISKTHYTQWFDAPSDVQVSMLKASRNATIWLNQKLERGSSGYSHLRTHVAMKGHQNGVAHVHMHVDV